MAMHARPVKEERLMVVIIPANDQPVQAAQRPRLDLAKQELETVSKAELSGEGWANGPKPEKLESVERPKIADAHPNSRFID